MLESRSDLYGSNLALIPSNTCILCNNKFFNSSVRGWSSKSFNISLLVIKYFFISN